MSKGVWARQRKDDHCELWGERSERGAGGMGAQPAPLMLHDNKHNSALRLPRTFQRITNDR